ncbi:hypothetical protein HC928_11635 [bacterium]|nr:hypothetical protein [bacterium]
MSNNDDDDKYSTPTIPEEAVRHLLSRIRRTSQMRIDLAALTAAEILLIDGILVQEYMRDIIEAAIARVLVKALSTHAEQYKRLLENENSKTEEALDRANQEVFRLRKLIHQFVQDHDLDKLLRESMK